jgi:hypothetical protein
MIKKYTPTKSKKRLLLSLAAVLILTLSCNLPFLNQSSEDVDPGLETSLVESGLLFVDDVTVTEDRVMISYQVLPDDDLEVMVTGWINAFLSAYEAEPDVVEYVLVTTLNGKPYLEIRADALEVEGLSGEEISVDLFLERLTVMDLQSLEDRVLSKLGGLGLEITKVSKVRKILMLEYKPGPAADQAALMEEWWSIFAGIYEMELSIDTVEIHALMPDESVFIIEGDVEDLDAFVRGEISSLQYLAGLSITEKTGN